MIDLPKTVLHSAPCTGVQFRKEPYGRGGLRDFLRDLIAMANAAIDGRRYIFVGVDFDHTGAQRLHPLASEDFAGKPSYESLAAEFVEPPIRLHYQPVTVDGATIGVYVIGDCQDKPYMMRIDHSETLRRGDAYIRIDDAAMKMGRGQLEDLFEQRFRDMAASRQIEVGFPGDIIHKELSVATVDLSTLPSIMASAKLRQLIDVRSRHTGSTTTMTRLTHARLFGADDPYEDRSPTVLLAEKERIGEKYRDDDAHFLFETHAARLQLVIYNQGKEALRDVALSFTMPQHAALHVAERLPKERLNGKHTERSPFEQDAYPKVRFVRKSVHVASTVGDIPAGGQVEAFQSPLRICAGTELAGRKVAIRYSLIGRNLREPASGKLRLLF